LLLLTVRGLQLLNLLCQLLHLLYKLPMPQLNELQQHLQHTPQPPRKAERSFRIPCRPSRCCCSSCARQQHLTQLHCHCRPMVCAFQHLHYRPGAETPLPLHKVS
jgi:hypothetical protein